MILVQLTWNKLFHTFLLVKMYIKKKKILFSLESMFVFWPSEVTAAQIKTVLFSFWMCALDAA